MYVKTIIMRNRITSMNTVSAFTHKGFRTEHYSSIIADYLLFKGRQIKC